MSHTHTIAQEDHLRNSTHIEIWKQLVLKNSYLVSKDVVPKNVCMFSSTVLNVSVNARSGVWSLAHRMSKYRDLCETERNKMSLILMNNTIKLNEIKNKSIEIMK